ncbi:uncharacterized protein LOC135120351 [Zophobas morio]|uniref:uncharacterized protein LOC135120351 n=1 Tax=Zophobas morio TaxID=2755281 RepID=UPI003082D5BE
MDLKEKLLAEEKKLKELTLAREERRRKRQQAREHQEDTNSPLNEEFKDETSTSGINVDSNGRKQKDEDLITEKIQATTNEPEAESRKWSNDDIKEKEAEVLTISDIDDLERTLRNLEAVCNDTNLSYEERSAVRRRIRKLKSEAITYQDVCSENKKDASGKENYKNKKEMFKTSMASNEGGNYPRPGFTRKTVESIKDKQEEERAAEFVNNQDVCKKNKKDATEDKYFEKKASKTLMGSHKGGSYPLQESSRKSVEPKQDKQKEERIAEFVETKKQAPEVKANDASDNLLNKGLPQNHEILLKELESVRDDPKATYNERSEARRKIRELKRDGYLMPDKGVKVDQKIPTKEIEKQSTKMQSQLKLNEEVGSRKSNESINEKYSGSKPSKQSKTNAGAAITKTPEKKEGKSKTLESPTLQVSKNVFKPAEGNLLKATVALLNKAFHKNIQCSERDLLTAIKDGVLLNQFLNYCVPDAIDERVINRNAGNNAGIFYFIDIN